MSGLSVPQTVGHNLARAKSLLKRDETLRALDAMIAGLDEYEPKKLMGKARFEIEVLVQECVAELNRQPVVRKLFETLTNSQRATVPYTPKQEDKLKGLLMIIHKALNESIASKERDLAEEKAKRRALLQRKGLEYLQAGDSPRGKAALRVMGDEYGDEPGLLAQIGMWFIEYNLLLEAGEMLEKAIDRFPKDSKAYGAATSCYIKARDYEKAERVYLKAVKQFGKHPRTVLNMAKLYVLWNKRDKAFFAAQDAYNKDHSLTEAKEIMDKFAG